MRWWDRAACIGEPLSTFYEAGGKGGLPYARARGICAGCSVRAECLDDALAAESIRCGFVGGMSPDERRVEWRRRKDAGLPVRGQRNARCGTESGYNRHRRLGELPCRGCLSAHACGNLERRGFDAYRSSPPVDYVFDLETIASRRDLYEDDEAG